MDLRKQQERITELYRRGDIDGAQKGFENLISYFEENDEIEEIAYAEALLGLGSLFQKDRKDLRAAETCWKKIVGLVDGLEAVLELEPDHFDLYTQALLLLALVQKDLGKSAEADKNLRDLRAIAVEVRGEKSDDVRAIDGHLARVHLKN